MGKNVALIIAMSLAVAACSGKDAGTPVPGAGLITGTAASTDVSGATMTLTPGTLRTCEHPDGRMVVKVSWDVRATGADTVTIWVNDGKSGDKRFFYGGPEGSAETGDWAADGVTFRMVDGSDVKGRTLITRTLHAASCLAEPTSAASSPTAS